MDKVLKDDSSDYKHEVENTPFYKLKLAVRSVERRKYEALTEKEEIAETPIARDAIIGDSAHGNSAIDDNDEYEPQEHQTGLDDVPQLTTQAQTCRHTDEKEDDKRTNCPRNNDMITGRISQPTTQPPEEYWPTETPGAPKTERNRSLEGNKKTNQNSADDNDKEEIIQNEDDDISKDNDKAAEVAVQDPYNMPDNEHITQQVKRMYTTPIDIAVTEDQNTMGTDQEPREELNDGTDDDMTHDEERTPEPISTSTPKSQDYYSSHSNSVCSYIDTSNMEITCSPTERNIDHVYADMTKKQIREEIFEMKNRIKWLEDRAGKQQIGPTDLIEETS